jgi:hypothetical protein
LAEDDEAGGLEAAAGGLKVDRAAATNSKREARIGGRQVDRRGAAIVDSCARAVAAPKIVTIPAAIASPRKAPPASALAPISRARRLPATLIGLLPTATSLACGPRKFALILVFMSAPRLLLSESPELDAQC